MPGVNEAELKARRRRSAAQLTSSLPGTGTGNRVSSGPDLDPAVAGVSDQPKEKLEDNNIAADVIMADRTEDGCCAKVSRCLNQRLVPIICGQAELPIPAGQKILFGPVDKPVRRESTNLAVALKPMTNTEA